MGQLGEKQRDGEGKREETDTQETVRHGREEMTLKVLESVLT